MIGYTKLFSSIVHSTVWREPHHVRLVWITMLALSDRDGEVMASIPGLADAARVTVEECEDAIVRLSSPDVYSRTPDHEGRRINAIPGGWLILNRVKYRQIASADHKREQARIRQQRKRERDRQKRRDTPVTGASVLRESQQTETETETETEKEKESSTLSSSSAQPEGEGGGSTATEGPDRARDVWTGPQLRRAFADICWELHQWRPEIVGAGIQESLRLAREYDPGTLELEIRAYLSELDHVDQWTWKNFVGGCGRWRLKRPKRMSAEEIQARKEKLSEEMSAAMVAGEQDRLEEITKEYNDLCKRQK